jgi:hypothetical protein
MARTKLRLFATGFLVILVIVGFVVGVVVKESTSKKADDPYNALFNFSPSGELGFWIYSYRGSCPDLRLVDPRPLVLIASPAYMGQGRIELAQLSVCMEIGLAGGSAQTTRCIDGFVEVSPTTNARERSGSYSVTLADGRKRSGEFRGVLCEPSTSKTTH